MCDIKQANKQAEISAKKWSEQHTQRPQLAKKNEPMLWSADMLETCLTSLQECGWWGCDHAKIMPEIWDIQWLSTTKATKWLIQPHPQIKERKINVIIALSNEVQMTCDSNQTTRAPSTGTNSDPSQISAEMHSSVRIGSLQKQPQARKTGNTRKYSINPKSHDSCRIKRARRHK